MERILAFAVGGNLVDANTFIVGNVDATKKLTFQVDTQATASILTIDVGAQTASRTLLVPVLAGTDTITVNGVANTLSAINTFSNTTAASSSTVGAVTIGNGVAATSMAFGGGKINAGDTGAAAISTAGGFTCTSVTAGTGFTHNASTNGLLSSTFGNSNAGSSAQYNIDFLSDTCVGALQVFSSTFTVAALRNSMSVSVSNASGSLFLGSGGFTTLVATAARNVYIGNTVNETGLTGSGGLKLESTTEATTTTAAALINPGGLGVAKRSYLGTIGATFKGNVAAGVQDATAAVAGQVGERTTSSVTAVAAGATGVAKSITSISLQGDFDISAAVVINAGATGLTNGSTIKCSIVTTTNTNGTSASTMVQESVLALLANGLFTLSIPKVPANPGSVITYYVTVECSYVAGSPTVDAILIATRMR